MVLRANGVGIKGAEQAEKIRARPQVTTVPRRSRISRSWKSPVDVTGAKGFA